MHECCDTSTNAYAAAEQKLTVFAAAAPTDAFNEISEQFKRQNPGVTLAFNYAGSQQLRTQLEQGAAADVFASANTKEMNGRFKRGWWPVACHRCWRATAWQ